MWESPINISTITEEIERKVTEAQEEYIYGQVRMVVDVDKDELIKALKYDRGQYERGYLDGRIDEQDRHRWIPVTERLPEYGQRVLVTYDLVKKYPWVNILRYGKPMSEDKPCFYEAGSEWGDVPYDGIVAWMPIPEPFKLYEVSDEEN